MKKAKHRILLLGALIVLIVIAQFVFYWATELTRAAKVAQIKKPASVLAYEQLAAKLDEPSGPQPTSQAEGSEKSDATRPAVLSEDPEETITLCQCLCEDVEDVFIAMMHLFDDSDSRLHDPETWSDDDLAQVSQFVHRIQPMIDQILELSQQNGPLHPLDFSKGMEAQPHIVSIGYCSTLLRAHATVRADEGDYRGAVEDIFAGMRLADALAQEPLMGSQATRISIHAEMNAALQQCIQVQDLPPDVLERLLSYVAECDNRRAFAESFAGTQVAIHNYFSQLRSRDYPEQMFEGERLWASAGIPEFINPPFMQFYTSWLGRPWMNMDESACTNMLSRIAGIADRPYFEARPELAEIIQKTENLARLRMASRNMAQSLERYVLLQAEHEARLDLAQMGLLVEQYQAQHGSYPNTLDAIAPLTEWSMPVDPFTGEPYRYYASDNNFQLYSIGWNDIDDGGILGSTWGEGDIVWRSSTE